MLKGKRATIASEKAPFDYTGLTGPIVKALRAAAERVRSAVQEERQAAIHVGQELIRAKDILKARSELFVPWLRQECGVNPRSANRYMATAREFGTVAEFACKSPAQVLYGLAQAKKPNKAQRNLIQAIKAGKVVSLADYRRTLSATPTERAEASGEKPGASVQKWWSDRPTPQVLVKYINERTFANFAKEVMEHFEAKPPAPSKRRSKAA